MGLLTGGSGKNMRDLYEGYEEGGYRGDEGG